MTLLFIGQLSAKNVIINGEFDNGLTGWNSGYINTSAGVVVTFGVDTNALMSGQNCYMIDVTNGGENTWDIQRIQDAPLEEGQTYELSFMAMFEGPHESVEMYVAYEIDDDPWTKYLYEGIELTLDPVVYGPIEYYVDSTITNNQLKFFPGGTDDVIIYLDAIVVNDEEEVDIEIDQDGIQPEAFSLGQNYPNPFNAGTKISFTLAKPDYTRLTVYNALGQLVATLVDQNMGFGTHHVGFDAKNLPSGIYLYQIESGKFNQVKKMIYIK